VVKESFLKAGAHYLAPDLAACPAIIKEIEARAAKGEFPPMPG